MDIIVNKVFDTLKFAYFMSIKYGYSLSYMNTIIESINKYGPIKFYNLLECEIRYLQRNPLEYGRYFIAINKPICNLKIINTDSPYLNKERKPKLNNMEKHQFKPFDQVLVRDYDDDPWRAMHYSHFNNEQQRHYCASSYWNQCIPYNENTAHLIGTNEPYEEPEPKIWYVSDINANSTCTMTQKQFEHFMKDILDNNIDGIYQIGKIIKNN